MIASFRAAHLVNVLFNFFVFKFSLVKFIYVLCFFLFLHICLCVSSEAAQRDGRQREAGI